MNTERLNKREREFYWDWFDNAQSHTVQDTSKNIFIANTVTRILQEAGADNCLHYLCGLGHLSRILAEKSRNILAYETSQSAFKAAQILSGESDISTIFFHGDNIKPLTDVIPHKVACVFSEELLLEPNWHELKTEFSRIYEILTPGGLLIFAGAGEHGHFAADLINEYDRRAEQELVWNVKDGRTQCTKLFIKSEIAEDYRDYKSLFVISTAEGASLECLEHRIPGYWNYHNIRYLAFETGFSHFESRSFTNSEGSLPEQLILNIAYKPGTLSEPKENYAEEAAYKDF